MGIFSDLNELRNEWGGAGLLKKTLIVVVLFVTTSSIASLSDVVFKWKGFILDGIQFYKGYINQPFRSLTSYINWDLTEIEADVFILSMLFFKSIARFTSYESEEIKEKNWPFFLIRMSFLLSFMVSLYFLLRPDLSSYAYILLILSGLVTISVYSHYIWNKLLIAKPTKIKYLVLIWGPLTFAIFVVLILGAINSGLSR